MSTDFYFVNEEKNEYVYAYGNHNRTDSLRCDWPKLFVWLMMNSWYGCNVKCIADTCDISFISSTTDMTNEYIHAWNTEEFGEGRREEHGVFELNQYAPEVKK
jgi:hypothetical protein